MCGRVKQAEELDWYQIKIQWRPQRVQEYRPGHNIPPGTAPLVLHQQDGEQHAECRHWGYKPAWSTRRPMSDARLDTVLKGSPFWRPLLPRRIIMPVDGWYEWTGDRGDRQPWYISAQDSGPVWLAGIAAPPGVGAEHGFAIVTDDAAGGLVDVHDRRPVALTRDDALAWMDPALPVPQALELLTTARPETAFQWWRVTRAVGNSRYQLPDASAPI